MAAAVVIAAAPPIQALKSGIAACRDADCRSHAHLGTGSQAQAFASRASLFMKEAKPECRSGRLRGSARGVICSQAAGTIAEVEATPTVKKDARVLPFRVGHGFDLHRLEPGLPLIIGSVNIPHDRGCEAHSDGGKVLNHAKGDVLLHCVVDAILGALSLPDIGQIFPDTDPKWRGAASSVFVNEAVKLMHEAGYVLGNLDATLILQKPKLSPHKESIRKNMCELLGADPAVVNIKAKTHEKVDSLGENRSIAAHTVVLLMRR